MIAAGMKHVVFMAIGTKLRERAKMDTLRYTHVFPHYIWNEVQDGVLKQQSQDITNALLGSINEETWYCVRRYKTIETEEGTVRCSMYYDVVEAGEVINELQQRINILQRFNDELRQRINGLEHTECPGES